MTTSSARTARRHARRPAHFPGSIAHAVVIKDEDLFFLCEPSGDVPRGNADGLGLYYHDCRFLNGYELRIAGAPPNALGSSSEGGFMAAFELTNHEIAPSRGPAIHKQRIGIRWERIVDARQHSLRDLLTIQNFSHEPMAFPLTFAFQSAFDDVFTIRGFHPGKHGRLKKPAWRNGSLTFAYAGADRVHRAVRITFDPVPTATMASTATVDIRLSPGQKRQVCVSLTIAESARAGTVRRTATNRASARRVTRGVRRSTEEWLGRYTRVTSDSRLLNDVIDRSLRDLRVLRSRLGHRHFFAGGLPWYGALFGRDSLVTALETLAYEPGIAADTLRLLADYQGDRVDAWRDEAPGKILHELRRGELAHLNEIPQTPYYGSVDSTPLFLVLIGQHAHWTGDLTLFTELRHNVERALAWIDKQIQSTGSGYLTYQRSSTGGLGNQGWKDSGDAIVNADGSLATAPIALVEVQGYVYLAKLTIADLYRTRGRRGNGRASPRRSGRAARAIQPRLLAPRQADVRARSAGQRKTGRGRIVQPRSGTLVWHRRCREGARGRRELDVARDVQRVGRSHALGAGAALQPGWLSPRHGVAARQCHHHSRPPVGTASTMRRDACAARCWKPPNGSTTIGCRRHSADSRATSSHVPWAIRWRAIRRRGRQARRRS